MDGQMDGWMGMLHGDRDVGWSSLTATGHCLAGLLSLPDQRQDLGIPRAGCWRSMPCIGYELKNEAGRERAHIKAMVDLTEQILHLLPTCKQMPVGTQQPWPRSFQLSPCLYAHAECCFEVQQCHTQQLCFLHLLLMLSLTVVLPGPPVTTALGIWLSPCRATPSTHATSLETG